VSSDLSKDSDPGTARGAGARGTDPLARAAAADGVPLRELVDLPPARQVAAAALNRVRTAAAARGIRPGDSPRRRAVLEQPTGSAGPGARDPQPVGASLGALVGQFGWGADLVGGTLQNRWSELVGPEVAAHCGYESLQAGVLVVRASSTAWATHLTWAVPAMLQRFAAELGEGVVSEIRVLGPAVPGFGRGPRRVRGRGERDTFG